MKNDVYKKKGGHPHIHIYGSLNLICLIQHHNDKVNEQ